MSGLLPPRNAICDELRRRAQPDGGLLGVFLDAAGQIVLCVEITEGTSDVDELFLRHLESVVDDVGTAAVVFGISRGSGRPLRIDRLLWRELSTRLADTGTQLLDVLVIGQHRRWSAALGRGSWNADAA